MKLLVIGAGAAGVAAAHRARQLGADVRLLHAGAGSSELYTGVVDERSWTQPAAAITPRCRDFCEALGLWVLPEALMVATGAGVVRPAVGADRCILNLAAFAGGTIAVASVERDEWDAHLLVRSLRESAWARRTGTRFETIEVPLLQAGHERRISAHDFARMHDAPRRWQKLCQRLRNAGTPDAWLCGPWLGIEPETVQLIREEMDVAVGEATCLPGGPAGARFVLARDRLLSNAGVDVRRVRVSRVSRQGGRWQAEAGDAECFHADAVVLALGGVSAGGIVLDSAENQVARAGFRLSLDAPVRMVFKGRVLDGISTEHGLDFALHGLNLLEQVSAEPVPNARGLCLAGDVARGRAHAVLRAVEDGICAAQQLCAEA